MKILDLKVIFSAVESALNGKADTYLKPGKPLHGTLAEGNTVFRRLECIQPLILPAREKCNQGNIFNGTLNLDTLLSAPSVTRGASLWKVIFGFNKI